MKRSVFSLLFLLLAISFFQPESVHAEVDEEELQQYLTSIYWTTNELEEYLQLFDRSIHEFDSMEQLVTYLGTPINNDNLNELLGKYEIDHSDLEILLAEYGESLDDYRFIEDLDLDVQFYLKHHEDFKIVNDFLSLFGLSEDEMKNLFNHFSALDETKLNDKLNEIYQNIYRLNYLRGENKLSVEDQVELFSLWDDLLLALNIQGKYFLVNDENHQEVQLKEIPTMGEDVRMGSDLQMALYNQSNEMLATLNFSEEMLTSYLMYESLEQISEVSLLASNYRTMVEVMKLPKTAGDFVMNILWSVALTIAGFSLVMIIRRRAGF